MSLFRLRSAGQLLGSLVFAAVPSTVLAQILGGAQAPADIPFWRVTAALVISLGLGFAAALALRGRLRGGLPTVLAKPAPLLGQVMKKWPQGAAPVRRLQLVETIRISHQVDVCLLRCDDAEFLLAATPQGAFQLATGRSEAPKSAA